jgi:hypothetical protein
MDQKPKEKPKEEIKKEPKEESIESIKQAKEAGMSFDEWVKGQEVVQRIEEPNVSIAFDKPQGLYTTPSGVKSPHAYLGGKKTELVLQPNTKQVTVDSSRLSFKPRGVDQMATNLVWLRQELPDVAESIRGMNFDELKNFFAKEFPKTNWNKYTEIQDMIEGYAGLKARQQGIDVIRGVDKTAPEFNEVVILNKDAVKTRSQLKAEWDKVNEVLSQDTSPKQQVSKQKDSKSEMDASPEKKLDSLSLKEKNTTKKELSKAKEETDKIEKLPPAEKTQTSTSEWRGEFVLPPETTLEATRRKVEDFNIRLKVLNTKIEEVYSERIEEHLNLWAQKDMLPRKQSDLLRRTRDKKQDFVKRLTEENIKIQDLGRYLHAKHAIERNKRMNELRMEKNKEPIDGLSGMTDKEAKKILAEDNKKFESFENEIYEMIDNTLSFQLKEGLLKQKEYDTIKNTYKNYVPLFRDVDNSFTGIGSGVDIKGKEIKRAVGSKKRVISPIENVFFQEERVQVRALKNKIGKTIIDLTKKYPELKNIFEIEKQQYIPRFNSDGELQFLDPKLKLGDNVVGTKIKGTQYFITVKDQKLARALKNLNLARIPSEVQFLRSALGIWGGFKTRWRPEFLITNFQRDLGEGLLNLGVEKAWLKKQGKGLRRDIIKDLFPSQKKVWRYLRGKDIKDVDEFFKLGGDAGHFWLEDINTAEESLIKLQKEIENIGIEKLKNPVRKIGKLADDINTMVELGIRFSTYKNLVSRGFSKEKAIQSAADLTVNFSRQGEWSPFLKSFYGFINPAIQGGSKVIRSLSSKEGGKSVAKGVTFLVALGFFTRMASMMISEEGDEQISDWDKNHKLTFTTGNRQIALWNMPYGFTCFYSMGSNMAEAMMGKKTWGEATKSTLRTTVDSFSPFGTSLNEFIPTLAKPIYEVNQNVAWHDGKIYPEQIFTKTPKPDVNTYFDSTSEASKFIAKFMNDISGGDTENDKAGFLDIHPGTLEYLYNQYFGGPFEFVTSSIEAGARGINGEFDVNKTPFVRQFYKETKPQQFSYKIIYDTLDKAYKKDLSQLEIDRFYRAVDIGLEENIFDEDIANGYRRDFIKARFRISGAITDEETITQLSKLPKQEQEMLINTYASSTQENLRKKLQTTREEEITPEDILKRYNIE